MNLLEKAMKKLTESKEIEVNENDMLTDIDNTEVVDENPVEEAFDKNKVNEDKINIEEIANKCLEQDTDYILEVIENCGSKKEFVDTVSEDPSDFGFDFIIPDEIFDTPNERKIYGIIYDKLTKQEAKEIEVKENDMLEADIDDVEVVEESKGCFLEVKAEDLIKEEVTPESDYYNYVKGLLDLGAIDDPKHVENLSDEEYERLIRDWMKDPEIKADYEKQQDEFMADDNDDNLEEAKKTLDDVYSDSATEALWDKKFKELVPEEGKANTDIGEIMRCFASMSHAYLQNGEIIANMQQYYLDKVWELDDILKDFGDSTLSGLLDKMYNTRSKSAYDHYMAAFYEHFVNNYLKDQESEEPVEESKENHGNKTTELNDDDPALKKPYESETVRDIAKNMKAIKQEEKEYSDEEKKVLEAFAKLEGTKTEEILKETGEWDDNDEDMASWKENLREQAKELANQIGGECKSVHGFDAYQGPFAIVNSPKHGDIQLWFDNEDDTGFSFIAKVAHVGWIGGGINDIANLLNQDEIPSDAVISECLHPEANLEEGICPDCGKEECECEEEIVENINKTSFNVMLTKFVKENYKNPKNLKINKVTKLKEGYKIEANLKMKDEKVIPVTFLAKGTITEGKSSILKVYEESKVFKSLDENKNMMTMIVSNNGTLKLEKLRYNFNTMLTENKKANVYGIIK